jgi:nucleoside-specific outer membrane channel protein Tsx
MQSNKMKSYSTQSNPTQYNQILLNIMKSYSTQWNPTQRNESTTRAVFYAHEKIIVGFPSLFYQTWQRLLLPASLL